MNFFRTSIVASLVMPLQLVSSFILMRILSAEGFGEYSYLTTILTLISLFYSFGLAQSIAKGQSCTSLTMRFFAIHLLLIGVIAVGVSFSTGASFAVIFAVLCSKFVYSISVGVLRRLNSFFASEVLLPVSQIVFFISLVLMLVGAREPASLILLMSLSFAIPAIAVFFSIEIPPIGLYSKSDLQLEFVPITGVMFVQRALAQLPLILLGFLGLFEAVAILKIVFLVMTLPNGVASAANPILMARIAQTQGSSSAEVVVTSRKVSLLTIAASFAGLMVFLVDPEFWLSFISWDVSGVVSLIVMGLLIVIVNASFGMGGSVLFGNSDLLFMTVTASFMSLGAGVLTFLAAPSMPMVLAVHGLAACALSCCYFLRARHKWGVDLAIFRH